MVKWVGGVREKQKDEGGATLKLKWHTAINSLRAQIM